MYINTFKYSPQDVSCQLCTEYVKKVGCTALRYPWLAERIEAGVVGYREAISETFSYDRRLFYRFKLLIKHFHGSLWSNEQHERRMQFERAVQKYRRSRDTNAYYAAMYLLTANDDIHRRTANCFCKHGIEFGYAVLRNISPITTPCSWRRGPVLQNRIRHRGGLVRPGDHRPGGAAPDRQRHPYRQIWPCSLSDQSAWCRVWELMLTSSAVTASARWKASWMKPAA